MLTHDTTCPRTNPFPALWKPVCSSLSCTVFFFLLLLSLFYEAHNCMTISPTCCQVTTHHPLNGKSWILLFLWLTIVDLILCECWEGDQMFTAIFLSRCVSDIYFLILSCLVHISAHKVFHILKLVCSSIHPPISHTGSPLHSGSWGSHPNCYASS